MTYRPSLDNILLMLKNDTYKLAKSYHKDFAIFSWTFEKIKLKNLPDGLDGYYDKNKKEIVMQKNKFDILEYCLSSGGTYNFNKLDNSCKELYQYILKQLIHELIHAYRVEKGSWIDHHSEELIAVAASTVIVYKKNDKHQILEFINSLTGNRYRESNIRSLFAEIQKLTREYLECIKYDNNLNNCKKIKKQIETLNNIKLATETAYIVGLKLGYHLIQEPYAIRKGVVRRLIETKQKEDLKYILGKYGIDGIPI